jgi:hypothetical protein
LNHYISALIKGRLSYPAKTTEHPNDDRKITSIAESIRIQAFPNSIHHFFMSKKSVFPKKPNQIKMLPLLISSILASTTLACNIPPFKLSNNITQGFSIQIQNASYPAIHNHFMNLYQWGGGIDQHLFVSPAGNSTSELTLINGVLTLPWNPVRHALIDLEYNNQDNTTKIFMTDRDGPRGIFDVVYGCDPDTDKLQTELRVKSRADIEVGGDMGIKPFGDKHDFRYRAPGAASEWKRP